MHCSYCDKVQKISCESEEINMFFGEILFNLFYLAMK